MTETIKIEDGIENKEETTTTLNSPMFDEIKLEEEFDAQWDHDYSIQMSIKRENSNDNKSLTSFECVPCKVVFDSHSHLNPLRCRLCPKTFKNASFLNHHFKIHSGIRPFKCGICNKAFVLNFHLKTHVEMHSEEKPIKCEQCNCRYFTKKSLRAHLKTHNMQNLIRGMKETINTKGETNTLEEIKLQWDHNYSIQNSIKVGTLNDTKFECVHCGKVFFYYDQLAQHLEIHSDLRPFGSKTFKHVNSLNSHLKIHLGMRLYKCGICDEDFILNSSLKKHVAMHREEEIFKCERCNRSYFTKELLNAHVKTHAFKCTLCPKTFNAVWCLNRHLKIHLGTRPFTCRICNKSYLSNAHYDLHMARHSGKKPFKCEQCNRSYFTKRSLNDHLRTYTKTRVMIPTRTKLVPFSYCTKNSTVNIEDGIDTEPKPTSLNDIMFDEIKVEEEFESKWNDDCSMQTLIKIETSDAT